MAKKKQESPKEASEQLSREEYQVLLKQEITRLISEVDSVTESLKEEGFEGHGYLPDAKFEISAELYTDVVGAIGSFRDTLDKVYNGIITQDLLLGSAMAALYSLEKSLIDKHLENARAGITSSEEDLNKSDSVFKVKESKIITSL